jgi:LPS-assembly protein
MVGLSSPTGLSLAAGARFDQSNFDLRRTDVSAAYTSRPLSVSGVYSFIEAQPDYGFADDRHEIRGRAKVKLLENWSAFGGATYDLTSEVLVRKSIGFAYDDDCFSYSLFVTEVEDPRNNEKSRSFGFNVTLRTIGEFGTRTDRLD